MVLTGCARSVDAADPGCVELWLEGGELRSARQRGADQFALLREDFHLGAERWTAWSSHAGYGMYAGLDDPMAEPFAGEGIELKGNAGGLSILVPVEPNMTLRFSGDSWDGETSGGSRYSLIELEDWPQAVGFSPQGVADFMGAEYLLPINGLAINGLPISGDSTSENSTNGIPGRWEHQETTVCVGSQTNAVLVSCLLPPGEEANGDSPVGRRRFRKISLDAVPLVEHWDRLARQGASEMRTKPGPFYEIMRAARDRLGNRLDFPSRAARNGLDHRRVLLGPEENVPGLVLLPGESVSWNLRVQRANPRLSFGISFWSPPTSWSRHSPALQGESLDAEQDGLSLRVNDARVAVEALAIGEQRDVTYALTAWKGARVKLTLMVEGRMPIAIARPELGPSLSTPVRTKPFSAAGETGSTPSDASLREALAGQSIRVQ